MVPPQSNQKIGLAVALSALAVLVVIGTAAPLPAQQPPVHYNHAGMMPPGAIGKEQLLRGGPLPGYFQPVEIRVPQGAMISTVREGGFDDPQPTEALIGMLIGEVYRMQITNIPGREGMEVYPTIEVINRLYPPLGQEPKFPVPVDLTQEELEMALDGKFVTRVIYLEDPDNALPVAEDPMQQSYFEAAVHENPLDVADRLGRPMAILRMGARLPDATGPDQKFLYGSPPLLKFRMPEQIDAPAVIPVPAAPAAEREASRRRPSIKQAASSQRKTIWRGQGTR
jgi:hypothetical protein